MSSIVFPVAEETINFVTVDEVGEEEVPHRTRSSPPKRTKQTAGNTQSPKLWNYS